MYRSYVTLVKDEISYSDYMSSEMPLSVDDEIMHGDDVYYVTVVRKCFTLKDDVLRVGATYTVKATFIKTITYA